MVWSEDQVTEGTYQWVVHGTAPSPGTGVGSGTEDFEMMVQRQEHLLMGGLVQPSDDVIQMV